MTLTSEDLEHIENLIQKQIENLIQKHLAPIQKDITKIKDDVSLLARLNQLDEIRKDSRLRILYQEDTKERA